MRRSGYQRKAIQPVQQAPVREAPEPQYSDPVNSVETSGAPVYHVSGGRTAAPRAVTNQVQSAIPQRQTVPQTNRVPNTGLPGKIYLRVESTSEDDRTFMKAQNLCYIFCDGSAEVIFYDKSTAEYKRMTGIKLAASAFVVSELRLLLGDENVVVK